MPAKKVLRVIIDDGHIDAENSADALALAKHALKAGKSAEIWEDVNGSWETSKLNEKLASKQDNIPHAEVILLRQLSEKSKEMALFLSKGQKVTYYDFNDLVRNLVGSQSFQLFLKEASQDPFKDEALNQAVL